MNRLLQSAVLILAIAPLAAAQVETEGPVKLDVLEVSFEPIAQGKNVVHIKVRNPSKDDRVFGVHIQTRSPDYGNGIGAGRQQFQTVAAGQTASARVAFKLPGPRTPRSIVRLRFYSLPNREAYDFNKPYAQRRFAGDQLPIRKAEPGRPIPLASDNAKPIIAAFQRLKLQLHDRKYHDAWNMFTPDWQELEYGNEERFTEAMRGEGTGYAFAWEPHDFTLLQPSALHRRGDLWTLTADRSGQVWTIDLVQRDGVWRVDWIIGHPLALQWVDWPRRLAGATQRRHTRHYEIHYKAGTTAARDIETIAAQRERAYNQIKEFVSLPKDVRINLYLFEDGRSKWRATGHRGTGWAGGDSMVEVYNAETKLDPYHEPAHILMRQLGSPPAIFNEGFAVFVAERLGGVPALAQLGGGKATLDQRARQLQKTGDWIPLTELLGYTEIGSAETRPTTAYPLAGSFTKFLIEEHGKDKFLQAYRELSNSNDDTVRKSNRERLESIYGSSIKQLETAWLESLSSPSDR